MIKRIALMLPFLLFALIGTALAQIGPPPFIVPHQFFPTAAAVYAGGPGDIVSGAKFFLSCTRAYTIAYANSSGKACNFRRDSDNHTCDFLFDTSGGTGNSANCSTPAENGTAPATWCNATTCHAVTAYDHTGNGFNVTQATASNQPTVSFSCGGSTWPCITGGGTSTLSIATTWASSPQPSSTTSVVYMTSGAGGQQLFSVSSNQNYHISVSNSGYLCSVTTTTSCSISSTLNKMQSMNCGIAASGGTSNCRKDSLTSTLASTPAASTTGAPVWISAGGFNGQAFEIGMWLSLAFTTTQNTSICQQQQAYYGSSLFQSVC
jgi:hypothetical protein